MLRLVKEPVRRTGVAVAAAFVAGSAIAALGLSRANSPAGSEPVGAVDLVLAAAYLSLPLVGAGLLWARPRQNLARLLLLSGVLVTGSQLAGGWAFYALRTHPGSLPGGTVAAWLASWLLVPGLGVGPFVLATFPSGAIRRTWLRWYAVAAAAGLALLTAAQAAAPDNLDGGPPGVRPVPNPAGVPALRGAVVVATAVGGVLVVGLFLLAAGDLVARFRRATGEERQQLRWVAAAASILPVATVGQLALEAIGRGGAAEVVFVGGQVAMLLGLSGAIAVAVLRHRLYDLDLVVSRSILYAGLTAFVALGYIGTVAVVGLVVRGETGPLASLVAAGAVALAFQPARVRLQRAADRVVHGTSGEPYAALADLGDRLAGAMEPAVVPQVLVDAVTRELRLPYAALEVDAEVVASSGVRPASCDRLPVTHSGVEVGTLVVGGRPGRPMRSAEQRLLRDLARQAGAALRVTTLSTEVQRARELAVSGREEERRRIRRDLHDGVGPALAGLALQAGALRQQLGEGMPAVQRLEAGLAGALSEVRRVAHGLRPPALDELGLGEALRQLCEQFDQPTLSVGAELPTCLPALPAATEVAVLRIASEALSNVARHAQASHCVLRLSVEGEVVLEVQDDGRGGATAGAGLGLRSMRERAQEIGGSCAVREAPGGGTLVRAVLGEVE
jgi:two-component system NarL family sensor kinase